MSEQRDGQWAIINHKDQMKVWIGPYFQVSNRNDWIGYAQSVVQQTVDDGKNTLGTGEEDVKIRSKRVGKID